MHELVLSHCLQLVALCHHMGDIRGGGGGGGGGGEGEGRELQVRCINY